MADVKITGIKYAMLMVVKKFLEKDKAFKNILSVQLWQVQFHTAIATIFSEWTWVLNPIQCAWKIQETQVLDPRSQ